jgi:hypothetical protein
VKTKGVEPRFVPDEEFNRVQAELKEQFAAGQIGEEKASQELDKLQNAHNMAHIEKLVCEAKRTRAEADSLFARLGIK